MILNLSSGSMLPHEQAGQQASTAEAHADEAGRRERNSGAAGRVVQCARVGREATRSGDVRAKAC